MTFKRGGLLVTFFMKAFTVVFHAFAQFYARVMLSSYVRGVRLPGAARVLEKQAPELQAAIERRLLVNRIRGERYSLRRGPIFLRKWAQRLFEFIQRNRFWASILVKLSVAFVFVVLPSAIFIIMRGTLPVPERVPERGAALHFGEKRNLRTDWLYTEPPFTTESVTPAQVANVLPDGLFRGVNVTAVSEPGAPTGLFHFGIGRHPRRVQLLRGYVASENGPLRIRQQHETRIDIAGRNTLRLKYYLVPNLAGQARCRIQIRDNDDKLLLTSEHVASPRPSESEGLRALFSERFTPGMSLPTYELKDFTFETDSPPSELRVQVSLLGEDDAEGRKDFAQPRLEMTQTERGPVSLRSLENEQCIFAIGDLSFESERVQPLARRGVVVVVVDTLRFETAMNSELMPNFNSFASDKAIVFQNHQAQSNMTVPSVASLMHSRYPRELESVSFNYAFADAVRKRFYERSLPSLAVVARNEGYRSAAIGNVSLFTEAIEGGIDFGFHDAVVLESPQYETRHITEEALDWLEENAHVPFVLYLHYHTMHGPFRPAVEYLDLTRFLSAPFGLRGQQELYKGLARYWDNEFRVLTEKLSSLGLLDDIDLIVTADHGAQITPRPYGYFSGIESDISGATADKGHTLSQEEVHVPFVVKLAGNALAGERIKGVSGHIDVLPTLSALLSNKTPTLPEWRGLTLMATNETRAQGIEDVLAKRDRIYYDAHRYSGVLLYGKEIVPPLKYVRQLEVDAAKMYRSKWPRRARETWFEPESYFELDFNAGTERWLPRLDGARLQAARRGYLAGSASPQQLKFKFYFDKSVVFKMHTKVEPKTDALPAAVKTEIRKEPDGTFTTTVSGTVAKGESAIFTLQSSDLLDLVPLVPLRFVACPTAAEFAPAELVHALKTNYCPSVEVPGEVVTKSFGPSDYAVAVTRGLAWENAIQLDYSGAGAALRKALEDWGYAK